MEETVLYEDRSPKKSKTSPKKNLAKQSRDIEKEECDAAPQVETVEGATSIVENKEEVASLNISNAVKPKAAVKPKTTDGKKQSNKPSDKKEKMAFKQTKPASVAKTAYIKREFYKVPVPNKNK